MDLVVNGETYHHTGDGSVADLLRECQADAARAAVMVNGEVVPRSRWDSSPLHAADRIEIVVFIGGG